MASFADLPPIKRVVDWEWCGVVAQSLLSPRVGVMRCFEDHDGRLYRVDTLELWTPNGEYRFRSEVTDLTATGGRAFPQ